MNRGKLSAEEKARLAMLGEARSRAADEEFALWRTEQIASTALALCFGDRAKAVALLQSAIAELGLPPDGGEKGLAA